MMAKASAPLDMWLNSSREAFDFWMSFHPAAPLFGIEWRFSGSMPNPFDMDAMGVLPGMERAKTAKATAPVEKTTAAKQAAPVEADPEPAPAAEPVAKAAEQASLVLEETAEIVEAATPTDAAPACLLSEAPANADDLKQIKGIGPGVEEQLNSLGIYKMAQIAGMNEQELAWLDERLTTIKGRCFRDDWVGQAKSLIG